MRYSLRKEQKSLVVIQRKMMLRLLFKSVMSHGALSRSFRNFMSLSLQRYYKRYFFVRAVSRCVFNTNSRSVHYFFRLARQELKACASYGLIYGLVKLSW